MVFVLLMQRLSGQSCRLPQNVVIRRRVIAVTVGRALAPDTLTAENLENSKKLRNCRNLFRLPENGNTMLTRNCHFEQEMEGSGGLERKVKVRFSRFFLWAVA